MTTSRKPRKASASRRPPPAQSWLGRLGHWLKWLLILAVLSVGGALGGIGWYATQPVALNNSPLDFEVTPGSTLKSAARQIEAAGVGVQPWLLVTIGRLARLDANLKAGSYMVETGVTPWQLLQKLTKGDTSEAEIAFIEGWTFRQMRERLNAHPDLRHDTEGLSDADVLRLIGASELHPEGLFFPDTYLFSKRSRDVDVLARAHRAMQRKLAKEWEGRELNLPYQNPYQALTMASIIEKETGRASDRPMIASVFVNRLRLGMRLQTDPSVIYGLGERFDGNLRKRDLLEDTPYNTYTRAGLTPTPIAMPGMGSLRAALHPAQSNALYFVAKGDGSSHFSSSLEEHNRAVARYQLGRAASTPSSAKD